MATVLIAHSRCECQALLSARLTTDKYVLSGTSFRNGNRERAPAHAIAAEKDVFDIGWLCPFCGRNSLRTFATSALQKMTIKDVTPVEEQPLPKSPGDVASAPATPAK